MNTISSNFSLKNYNTFNIDVKSDKFISINTEDQLIDFLSKNKDEDNIFFLGGGSNVLFSKDYKGTIVHISIKGKKIIEESNDNIIIEVNSGENWHEFVKWSIEKNYGGIENLSLIPGNVGAAPIQNIGAYGVELKDVFDSCRVLSIDSNEIKHFNKDQCEFDYRSSVFKSEQKNKHVILSIRLKLTKEPHSYNLSYDSLKEKFSNKKISLSNISEEIIKIRESKLPDPKKIGNCGSFFKNPLIESKKLDELLKKHPQLPYHKNKNGLYKIPAAWLIEKMGFKQKSLGDVGVYINQPLVIVNNGNANGSDILNFANSIKDSVKKEFNIELEEEVKII
ncbi:MAG: UDP-N-acetylmuramate dehydrogenase [Flavobacteriales bacterium]|nr:MAG: UDP-N-acetylmuramate dehydrogenase [Flavobacteriales bacterium]|tara:strand:+ start:2180 stop:3190 length:1011 start_codon:yes stop_codon:yes gene_type:complete